MHRLSLAVCAFFALGSAACLVFGFDAETAQLAAAGLCFLVGSVMLLVRLDLPWGDAFTRAAGLMGIAFALGLAVSWWVLVVPYAVTGVIAITLMNGWSRRQLLEVELGEAFMLAFALIAASMPFRLAPYAGAADVIVGFGSTTVFVLLAIAAEGAPSRKVSDLLAAISRKSY